MSRNDDLLLGGALLALGVAFAGGKKKKNGGPTRTGDLPEEPPPPVDEPDPPEPDPNVSPLDVFDDFLRPEPTIGFLYQVRQGDNLTNVARRALGVGVGDPRTTPYMRRLAMSRWNWTRYAQANRASQQWSFVWNGERGGIYPDAWRRVHDPVRDAIEAGDLPVRMRSWNVNPNTNQGAPLGRTAHGPLAFPVLFMVPDEHGDPNDPTRNPTDLLHALGVSIGDLHP